MIRKDGKWGRRLYTLIPSYVFVGIRFAAEIYYTIRAIPSVIRFVGTGSGEPSTLTYLEAEWIRLLAGDGEPLEPTVIRMPEDGMPEIVGGVLAHFPARVVEYDLRHKRAKVTITLCGEPVSYTHLSTRPFGRRFCHFISTRRSTQSGVATSTPSSGSAKSCRSYTIPFQAMRRSPGTSGVTCRCRSRCWDVRAKRHTETAAPHISAVYTTI